MLIMLTDNVAPELGVYAGIVFFCPFQIPFSSYAVAVESTSATCFLIRCLLTYIGLSNGTSARLRSLVLDPSGGTGAANAAGDRHLPCLPLYALVEVPDVRLPFDFGYGENILPVLPKTGYFKTTLHYKDEKGRATSSEHTITRHQLPFIPLYAMTGNASFPPSFSKS
jgi:hypothetical protein